VTGLSRGARAIIGLMVLALIYVGYLEVIAKPRAARQQAAEAKIEAKVAGGMVAAAREAITIHVDRDAVHDQIDIVTRGNDDAIRSAPGASAAIPPAVAAAGRAALCVRGTYQRNPACAAVHGPRAAKPHSAHAGSTHPAGR
jgi:hypothetical protein